MGNQTQKKSDGLFFICISLWVALALLGVFAGLQNEELRQLKSEAFQRGYAVFEPNGTSGFVDFKWKEGGESK